MTDEVTTMAAQTHGQAGSVAEPDAGLAPDAAAATDDGAPVTDDGADATDDGANPVPFGAWQSPITAAQVAGGRIRLTFPTVIGETIWWQEDRPEEGGRTTIVRSDADGAVTTLLAAPWAARTRVHEYGGLSYLPVPSPTASATLAAAGPSTGEAETPSTATPKTATPATERRPATRT